MTQAVAALGALAQATRLSVFRALVQAGDAGRLPGELGAELAIPAATLSFHLKELANSGLVTQERASRHLIYRAAYENMNALVGYLTDNCCAGTACAVATADDACNC